MNAERLLKLADFLDKLPPSKFNYSTVVKGKDVPRKELDCGSVACAVGWCPVVFPELAEYGDAIWTETECFIKVRSVRTGAKYYELVAAEIFDLNLDEAVGLFTPGLQYKIGLDSVGASATPGKVADLIRRFVARESSEKVKELQPA